MVLFNFLSLMQRLRPISYYARPNPYYVSIVHVVREKLTGSKVVSMTGTPAKKMKDAWSLPAPGR